MNLRRSIDIPTWFLHIGIEYQVNSYDVVHDAINYAETGEFPEPFPYEYDYDSWPSRNTKQTVSTGVYLILDDEPSAKLQKEVCMKMAKNLKNKSYEDVRVSVIEYGVDTVDHDKGPYMSGEYKDEVRPRVQLRLNNIQITHDGNNNNNSSEAEERPNCNDTASK